MREDRLHILAEFLDTLPDDRFDYGTWVLGEWQGSEVFSCGTTACAMGWACSIPAFMRKGLKISPPGTLAGGVPEFDGSFGFYAAVHFFDVNLLQAQYLFSPTISGLGNMAKPGRVARHIRSFIKKNL